MAAELEILRIVVVAVVGHLFGSGSMAAPLAAAIADAMLLFFFAAAMLLGVSCFWAVLRSCKLLVFLGF